MKSCFAIKSFWLENNPQDKENYIKEKKNMKCIATMIALAAGLTLCAQTQEFKTFGEAMRAGKTAWDTGRTAEVATYKAWTAKNKEEAAKQQKIWFENYEKGGAAYQMAVKLAPDDKLKSRALHEAANCIFRLPKRQGEGVVLVKQAYELQPENGQYIYTYTWMLSNSGKSEECCQVAEKFLSDKNYKKTFAVNVITDNYIPVLLRLKRFDDAKKINAELVKAFSKYDKSQTIDAAEKKANEKK